MRKSNLGDRKQGEVRSQDGRRLLQDFAFSTSGNVHALSNKALVGPYSRNMSSKRRSGAVGTQFASLPSGAFGPNHTSTEPPAFFFRSAALEARLARSMPLISACVSRS